MSTGRDLDRVVIGGLGRFPSSASSHALRVGRTAVRVSDRGDLSRRDPRPRAEARRRSLHAVLRGDEPPTSSTHHRPRRRPHSPLAEFGEGVCALDHNRELCTAVEVPIYHEGMTTSAPAFPMKSLKHSDSFGGPRDAGPGRFRVQGAAARSIRCGADRLRFQAASIGTCRRRYVRPTGVVSHPILARDRIPSWRGTRTGVVAQFETGRS
jgi:hypothetical protein